MTATLDELLRDVAKRGDLTHLSVAWVRFDEKTWKWAASYSPAKQWGCTVEYADDPVTAAVNALQKGKTKRARKNVSHSHKADEAPPVETGEEVSDQQAREDTSQDGDGVSA